MTRERKLQLGHTSDRELDRIEAQLAAAVARGGSWLKDRLEGPAFVVSVGYDDLVNNGRLVG